MLDDYKHSFSPMGASNCWAVSGNFTESGFPMLSSDPHLANSIPALWYLISLESRDGAYKGTGASFYGYPGVGIGRTPHSAFGISNTKVDNIDLYLEQIENDKYFHDNEWKAMTKRTEVIKVRGAETVEFDIFATHHGPVFRGIEDYSKLHFLIPGLVPVSLENIAFAWAHLQVHDSSTERIYLLGKAKTGAEVRELLLDPKGLMLSYIWAGTNGDLAYASPGAYPVR
jgi:penicillin amidase